MANYTVTDSDLSSIANAIRSKGGTLEFLTYPSDFITAIEEIQTGGTLQSKSVIPSESSITVVPDVGYDGLSQVSVDAISSNYIGSGVARKSAADVTVSGPTVTAPAGYYGTQVAKTVSAGAASVPATTINTTPSISVSAAGLISVSVSSSSNISPSIASGYISSGTSGKITVSGSASNQLSVQAGKTVTPSTSEQTAVASGKYTTGVIKVAAIPSKYKDTTNANAVASNVLIDKIFINSTGEVTGTMVNNGAITKVLDATTGNQSYTVPTGYHNGSGTINITLEEKTITPSESVQTATPSAAKVLSKVTVNAISSNYVGSNIPVRTSADLTASGSIITVPAGYYSAQATKAVSSVIQATPTIIVSTAGLITATATQTAGYVAAGSKSATKQLTAKAAATYTPSTTNQTIASGQYLTGIQTITGDSNLIAGNIKLGTNIFGISGTYEDFPVANAVLHINAPLGSTITLSQASSISIDLDSTKGHPNIDGNTMDWYYSVSSSNYGYWAISAFNSNADSTYAFVTIDSAKQYDVQLDYNLYIIKNGVEQSGFTITYSGLSSYTVEDGILYMVGSTSAGGLAVGPLPSVDNCSTMVFEFEKIENIGNNVSFAAVGEGTSYKSTAKTYLANSAAPITVNVDVSSISVYNLYAKVRMDGGSAYLIRKVWLKNIYLAR